MGVYVGVSIGVGRMGVGVSVGVVGARVKEGVAVGMMSVCVGLLVGVNVGVSIEDLGVTAATGVSDSQAERKSAALGTNHAPKAMHTPKATMSTPITPTLVTHFFQLTGGRLDGAGAGRPLSLSAGTPRFAGTPRRSIPTWMAFTSRVQPSSSNRFTHWNLRSLSGTSQSSSRTGIR